MQQAMTTAAARQGPMKPGQMKPGNMTHRIGAECPGDEELPELPRCFRMLCGEVLDEDSLEVCAEEWQEPSCPGCLDAVRNEERRAVHGDGAEGERAVRHEGRRPVRGDDYVFGCR